MVAEIRIIAARVVLKRLIILRVASCRDLYTINETAEDHIMENCIEKRKTAS